MSYQITSPEELYAQLAQVYRTAATLEEQYALLRRVFGIAVQQRLHDCPIAFAGFFSKVDYLMKECRVPYAAADLIQQTRADLFPKQGDGHPQPTAQMLRAQLDNNVKGTALLVHHTNGLAPIPLDLQAHFPTEPRQRTWGRYAHNVLRVITQRWDDDFIWATDEESGATLQVCYSAANPILTRGGEGDWGYLREVLWEGAVLHLVRVRRDQSGQVCLPELIILEPDYLVNITTIARCFETYAESPRVALVDKLRPAANSYHIHLGNLAGQLLDDVVHERHQPIGECLKTYVADHALSMMACPELVRDYELFREEAAAQQRNIQQLIGQRLPEAIGHYDRRDVLLEPSFFSSVLGIQGRLDFLYTHEDGVTIIEQKSGKGDYVSPRAPGYNPAVPRPREQHVVQALLYRALFVYEFQKYADQLRHVFLLYSRYGEGLVHVNQRPALFLRAIRLRNLLVRQEIHCARHGFDVLLQLTPEALNEKGLSGRLWLEYVRPELNQLLAPIHQASPLERAYYLRFLRFLATEQLHAKMGNPQREGSGFASLWHDTLEQKRAAGNIYDRLRLTHFEMNEDGDGVSGVTLAFPTTDRADADSTNFRTGDVVLLYSYNETEGRTLPSACAQMVHRASIVDIQTDHILLRLRNGQTDPRAFTHTATYAAPDRTAALASDDQRLWAIEHDMLESSANGQYSALHSFLSAPKDRRDLLLCQRAPWVDAKEQRRGEYGGFNPLVERAVQARDLFLIIGPPGTGKTSFGLVNLLREELLDPDAQVLLMAYTNRAVDEICSKLVELQGIDFVRIGSDLSCAEAYRPYLLRERCRTLATGSAVRNLLQRTRIVCGTTAAISAQPALLQMKTFSLAIIDEASQLLEPHLIGLLSAHKEGVCRIRRFVLIGDHKQLPAVVQQTSIESTVEEPELRAIHLTDCRHSLFERLLQTFRTAEGGYDPRYVYLFTRQGRMHEDISRWVAQTFYAQQLGIVPLPHQQLPLTSMDTPDGILRLLSAHRLAFVASPPIDSTHEWTEAQQAGSNHPAEKTNPTEARMIAAIVARICRLQPEARPEESIGIIVPYRGQIATVRNQLDSLGIPGLHKVTIDTVERYQGSQRDYIIYGFTVKHPYQLNFLTDNTFEEGGQTIDRKLNVALTRARLGMILVGNPQLLNLNPTFASLIRHIREAGGYVNIPPADFCKGKF